MIYFTWMTKTTIWRLVSNNENFLTLKNEPVITVRHVKHTRSRQRWRSGKRGLASASGTTIFIQLRYLFLYFYIVFISVILKNYSLNY